MRTAKALLVFACLSSGVAIAGDQSGAVADVRVSSRTSGTGNPTHLKVNGVWNARPACATSGFWAIDTDTVVGKNMLATILMALAATKTITLWGTGECTLRADMENVAQIAVYP